MRRITRREFLGSASAATTLGAIAAPGILGAARTTLTQRVFIGSHAPDGILAYDWDPASGTLTSSGVAAKVPNVDWLALSHGFVYSASEMNSFDGKPTGRVSSFRLAGGELQLLSARNSAGPGTCHVAVDATGRMLLAADYSGGSAASFRIKDGKLSEAVWTEHYTEHGPESGTAGDRARALCVVLARQPLCLHQRPGRRLNPHLQARSATARMTPAGTYRGAPGSGPRTLHFHPNGRTAYCMNEMASTVDVLEWHKTDGSLTLVESHRAAARRLPRTYARLRYGDYARWPLCLLRQSRRQLSLRFPAPIPRPARSRR